MVVSGDFIGRSFSGLINMKHLLIVLMLLVSFNSQVYCNARQDEPTKLNVNKTMVINFFKSLIIPGWGQWENGNKIRAIGYVAAEVASIYGYQSNYSEGDDLEQTFKKYGDEHWYFGRWSPNNDPIGICGSNLHTHNMPLLRNPEGEYIYDDNGYYMPLKDHHFYENIGKYPEFSCGWDDFHTGAIGYDYDHDEDTNKAYYIDMRTRSNELFRNAQVASTLIMVNHLISAFDAALGTDVTTFETTNMTGKLYINPLNTMRGIRMEVKF